MSLQLAQNDLLRELTDDCAQFIEELKKSPDTEILVNDGL